jgi:5'-nucleotidase
MPASLEGQLVVAISSRALFDFEEENQVFEQGDDRAYMKLQLERLEAPAKPGVAFSLVRKLLAFNDADAQRVEVVILSRNDPVSGMRVFRSAQHYGLPIQRGSFTRGQPPWRYLRPLNANLFLSTHLSDVRAALDAGVPAAQVYPHRRWLLRRTRTRCASLLTAMPCCFPTKPSACFSTRPVGFSETRKRQGRATPAGRAFQARIASAAPAAASRHTGHAHPHRAGHGAQRPAHERAIRTLMDWNIEVDEAMFLGGLPKGEFLREFEPDFFFDDQTGHIESAARHVPSGHVASGVSNPA